MLSIEEKALQLNKTVAEVQELEIKASYDPTARKWHRTMHFTIVDLGPSWACYKNGVYLNTVSWDGHRGTPKDMPCVDKATYFQNLQHLELSGIGYRGEYQLREEGLTLHLNDMLQLMSLQQNLLVLPKDIKFAKKSYAELKQRLKDAGATYMDSAFSFSNSEAAKQALDALLAGQKINIRKSLQYFPTKGIAADRLLDGVDLAGKVVYEPHGGEGYLAKAIFERGASKVLSSEIYMDFHEKLRETGAEIIGTDVFDVPADDLSNIDTVIMNPPFSGGQDVDHLMHILSVIPDHVEVHAIMSGSIKHNQTKKYVEFRNVLNAHGIELEELDRGAFKESGTMVETCIVRIPSSRALNKAA